MSRTSKPAGPERPLPQPFGVAGSVPAPHTRCNTKPVTRIARRLRITREEAKAFCTSVVAASSPGLVPTEFDIVRALDAMCAAKPAPSEVAILASRLRADAREERKLRRLREASRRQAQDAARSVFAELQSRRLKPTANRCRFCGRPSVIGGDVCYGCG